MIFSVPTNFKKAKLIFGMYRPIDMIIIGLTGSFSLISAIVYIFTLNGSKGSIPFLITLIVPALIGTGLTIPFPIFQNILGYLISLWQYMMRERKYTWGGFQYSDDTHEDIYTNADNLKDDY